MRLLSYAKINLYLDVIGRDVDGYHFIESLFQEVSLADEIFILPSEEDIVTFEKIQVEGDTTIHRALRLFRETFTLSKPYHVHVIKHIPLGAGLGGGSSNAAAVLRALASLEGVEEEKIYPLATRIGSDVSFFLVGGMAWVSGKGEKIEPLPYRLRDVYFLLVYPNIHVRTSWAYSLISDYTPHALRENILASSDWSLDFLRKIVYNKFQPLVFSARADLFTWKEKLDSQSLAAFSFMSGSGSSLVYVYDSTEKRDTDRKQFSAMGNIQAFCVEPVYP